MNRVSCSRPLLTPQARPSCEGQAQDVRGGLRLLGRGRAEDVEPDLDLGLPVERHVALRAGDAHRLAGGRERASVFEIDFDGELGAVAGELDVFHDVCPFLFRVVACLRFVLSVNGKGYRINRSPWPRCIRRSRTPCPVA